MKLTKIVGLMGAFSSLALASGLNTNTNQSAAYLRNVARYATTEADAPYYNPAGPRCLVGRRSSAARPRFRPCPAPW